MGDESLRSDYNFIMGGERELGVGRRVFEGVCEESGENGTANKGGNGGNHNSKKTALEVACNKRGFEWVRMSKGMKRRTENSSKVAGGKKRKGDAGGKAVAAPPSIKWTVGITLTTPSASTDVSFKFDNVDEATPLATVLSLVFEGEANIRRVVKGLRYEGGEEVFIRVHPTATAGSDGAAVKKWAGVDARDAIGDILVNQAKGVYEFPQFFVVGEEKVVGERRKEFEK